MGLNDPCRSSKASLATPAHVRHETGHGSHIADAFAPLLLEPVLTERYQLALYHRRGFAGSTHPNGPLSIAQQAADCRAFMGQVGLQCAHIVGHSYGGAIALQLALDAPESVHSLALLEPALFDASGMCAALNIRNAGSVAHPPGSLGS
jgi:pimeloyl-ACP methyl ester carboxylesterase